MEESHLDIEKTRWRGAQSRRASAVLFTFSSEIHLCQTDENNHQHYRIAVVDVVSHPAVNTDLAGSALIGLVAALLRFSPTRLSQAVATNALLPPRKPSVSFRNTVSAAFKAWITSFSAPPRRGRNGKGDGRLAEKESKFGPEALHFKTLM